MKKILVFAGSNSLNSINKKFAVFAAGKLNDVTLEIVDLNNFQLPTFTSLTVQVFIYQCKIRFFLTKNILVVFLEIMPL